MLVQGLMFGALLLVQVSQSTWVGLGQHACPGAPISTCHCWGEQGPALVALVDGDLGYALHLWGRCPPRGGWWAIRNRHTFYFLNNAVLGALCWDLWQTTKHFLKLLCILLSTSRKPDLAMPETTHAPCALVYLCLCGTEPITSKHPAPCVSFPGVVSIVFLHQFGRIRFSIGRLCSHWVGLWEQSAVKISMLPC